MVKLLKFSQPQSYSSFLLNKVTTKRPTPILVLSVYRIAVEEHAAKALTGASTFFFS